MIAPPYTDLPFDALVFDLGGVIVPHDNELLYRRLADQCAADDALDRIRTLAHDDRYGTGELTIADLHDRLCRDLGYGLPWADFAEVWCSHLGIDIAMLDFVTGLAARHRVMLFSNTNREHWDHLVAMTNGRLASLEAYLSFEIGLVKPSQQAFHWVAAQAGIAPSRSLFIDDLPANVDGARAAGFQAVVFTGQAALEEYFATAR